MLFEYVRIHHKKEVLCNRIKKILRTRNKNVVAIRNFTDMAELADALDSGSSEGSFMQVQVLLSAPCRVFLQNLKL